jgi:hypothetical protein
MSDRVEQRVSGTHLRRRRGRTSPWGNKRHFRDRGDTFAAYMRKEEGLSIKSKEEQETALVVA